MHFDFIRTTLAIAATAGITACSTVMPNPSTGFLSDYAALQRSADSTDGTRHSPVAVDPSRTIIADIEWRTRGADKLDPPEQARMKAMLLRELQGQLSRLPAVPGGRPAVVRAAITRVETVSGPLNAVTTALVFVPIDRGGAAVEIEALDAESKQQLAAMTLGYFAPMSDLGARFSRLAPAEIALKKAAADFAPLLQPVVPVARLAAAQDTSSRGATDALR